MTSATLDTFADLLTDQRFLLEFRACLSQMNDESGKSSGNESLQLLLISPIAFLCHRFSAIFSQEAKPHFNVYIVRILLADSKY